MAGEKPDVLLVGHKKPVIVGGLEGKVTLHKLIDATDKEAFLKSIADKVRAIAVAYTSERISPEFIPAPTPTATASPVTWGSS